MLRLSRFRARRGVFGSRSGDFWNACGDALDEERCGWNDDIGAGSLLQLREVCSSAADNAWPSRCESSDRYKWGMNKRGSHLGCSRVQYRGYADGADGADDLGGRDERELILDVIEKDMKIQDDVAMYLYSKTREMDPKTLLGAMYVKAGLQPPRYSVSSGFKNKSVATVEVRGKRFNGLPSDSEEEAEKSAADSALSWVLGQPRQGSGTGFQQERGRGRGGGMMRGGAVGRGRGRGRGRGGGNLRRRGGATISQRVPIKPRKCFQVEINYKLMRFVVLYESSQPYYPYKEFPSHRNRRPPSSSSSVKKKKNEEEGSSSAEPAEDQAAAAEA